MRRRPDTPGVGREMAEQVERARRRRPARSSGSTGMVPREDLVPLYTQAAVFVCPSVYEPFGIINLEAMACGTPVVASAVGGIPEVVVHGETGLLVPLEARGGADFEPRDPDRFARDLAAAVNELMADPPRRERMGRLSRRRVEERFGWASVARRTLDFYRDLTGGPGPG